MKSLQAPDPMPEIGTLYEPDPVLFSFEAPGWQVVGSVLLLIAITGTLHLLRRYRRRAYRRMCIRKLTALPQHGDADWLYQVNRILKVVAMQTYGRTEVAALSGADWVDFLRNKGLEGEMAEPLSRHYDLKAKLSQEVTMALAKAAKNWIKRHA